MDFQNNIHKKVLLGEMSYAGPKVYRKTPVGFTQQTHKEPPPPNTAIKFSNYFECMETMCFEMCLFINLQESLEGLICPQLYFVNQPKFDTNFSWWWSSCPSLVRASL